MSLLKKHNGFALTEVILAIVLMLIVTVAGIKGYMILSQSNQDQKIENRVYESIRTAQSIRIHMVDFLTNTMGVGYLVSAVNTQLGKDMSYVDPADMPTVSSGAASGNLGILRVAVPLRDTQTCLGVGKQFLWSSTGMYKGVEIVGASTTAKAGIIDYTKIISSVPSDGNFSPFYFKGNPTATLGVLSQACLSGATMYVYF